MREILNLLLKDENLTQEQIKYVVKGFANHEIPPVQVAAFIISLTKKGVSYDELEKIVIEMRKQAIRVEIEDENIVDSCGTGADGNGTFNISTASAILACSAGAKVIKQTNSNITSRCGSSNFLQALGIKICDKPKAAIEYFNLHNITFLHSPNFNRVANFLNPIRRELGIKSIFNYIGPMINASYPKNQLIGVSNPEIAKDMINILKILGLRNAIVVNAENPLLDEISICSPSRIFELRNGEINDYFVKPESFGLKSADISEIKGATAEYNVDVVRKIFEGKIKGAKLDIVALNAGAMLYLGNIVPTIQEGIIKSYFAISSSKAIEKLNELISHKD